MTKHLVISTCAEISKEGKLNEAGLFGLFGDNAG